MSDTDFEDDGFTDNGPKLARIKYLTGSRLGTQETIGIERLSRKFKSCNDFEIMKKYLVDGELKVRILYLAETQEEMDEKMTLPLRLPPLKDLNTASESESNDLNANSKVDTASKKLKNRNSGRSSKEDKNKFYSKLLNIKKEKIAELAGNKTLQVTEQRETEKAIHELSDKENDTKLKGTNVKKLSKRSHSPASSTDETVFKKTKSSNKVNTDKNPSLQFEPSTSSSGTSTAMPDNNEPKNTDGENNQKLQAESSLISAPAEKPKVKQFRNLTEEIKNLEEKVKRYRESSEKFKKEKSKIEKKYNELKITHANAMDDFETVKKLNYDLQKKVIEIAEERQIIDEQMKEAEKRPMANPQDLPVGYRKSDGKSVHLGNKVYMAAATLDNVICNSNTPAQFVGNLLLAQFSERVLINSTRTGRPSNKSIGRTKKQNKEHEVDGSVTGTEEDSVNEQMNKSGATNNKPNKLDASELEACKLYYGHWLDTHYVNYLSVDDKRKFDRSVEYNLFKSYVTTKISNLKKPKGPSKKKCLKNSKKGRNSKSRSTNGSDSDLDQQQEHNESLDRNQSLLFVPTNNTISDEVDFDESLMITDDETDETVDPLMEDEIKDKEMKEETDEAKRHEEEPSIDDGSE